MSFNADHHAPSLDAMAVQPWVAHLRSGATAARAGAGGRARVAGAHLVQPLQRSGADRRHEIDHVLQAARGRQCDSYRSVNIGFSHPL